MGSDPRFEPATRFIVPTARRSPFARSKPSPESDPTADSASVQRSAKGVPPYLFGCGRVSVFELIRCSSRSRDQGTFANR